MQVDDGLGLVVGILLVVVAGEFFSRLRMVAQARPTAGSGVEE
jgi:hypothetical protein